jgi:hypothetical protein
MCGVGKRKSSRRAGARATGRAIGMPSSACRAATKTLLVVLQCAYGSTEKRRRQLEDRTLWLYGLWHSHTGGRLKEMIPDGYKVVPINATPKIGKHPNARFSADPSYISDWIERVEPDVVLGCGLVARSGLDALGVDYVPAPHPAWRQFSKEDALAVRRKLEEMNAGCL